MMVYQTEPITWKGSGTRADLSRGKARADLCTTLSFVYRKLDVNIVFSQTFFKMPYSCDKNVSMKFCGENVMSKKFVYEETKTMHARR